MHTVLDSGVDVFAQNVETVERLTHPVRDPRAGYRRTLDVLAAAKAHRPAVLTKTSLMLGLGETDAEIREAMKDLRAAAVDLLTLGQYLRPTPNHLAVERFVSPGEFADYRARALELGFLECVSGPLVRSSYRAEQALARNNAGSTGHRIARRARRDAMSELPAARDAAARLPLIRHLGLAPYEPTWRAMQRFTDERDRRNAGRDLAARASAGVHARAQREAASISLRRATFR